MNYTLTIDCDKDELIQILVKSNEREMLKKNQIIDELKHENDELRLKALSKNPESIKMFEEIIQAVKNPIMDADSLYEIGHAEAIDEIERLFCNKFKGELRYGRND